MEDILEFVMFSVFEEINIRFLLQLNNSGKSVFKRSQIEL